MIIIQEKSVVITEKNMIKNSSIVIVKYIKTQKRDRKIRNKE